MINQVQGRSDDPLALEDWSLTPVYQGIKYKTDLRSVVRVDVSLLHVSGMCIGSDQLSPADSMDVLWVLSHELSLTTSSLCLYACLPAQCRVPACDVFLKPRLSVCPPTVRSQPVTSFSFYHPTQKTTMTSCLGWGKKYNLIGHKKHLLSRTSPCLCHFGN